MDFVSGSAQSSDTILARCRTGEAPNRTKEVMVLWRMKSALARWLARFVFLDTSYSLGVTDNLFSDEVPPVFMARSLIVGFLHDSTVGFFAHTDPL